MVDSGLMTVLAALGLPAADAGRVRSVIDRARASKNPASAWNEISRHVLCPAHDFAIHQRLYDACYADDAGNPAPGIAWIPSPQEAAATNIAAVMRELGLDDYAALHHWSATRREEFWAWITARLGIVFDHPYERMLDNQNPAAARWMVGAKLNIVRSCFDFTRISPDAPVIAFHPVGRPPQTLSYGQLWEEVKKFAMALRAAGLSPGDAVAILLPLEPECVIAYLGTIAAGMAAISIAESFSSAEIATRLRIGGAKLIVTADHIRRGDQVLPLYEKILSLADAPRAVVITSSGGSLPSLELREGDRTWNEFHSSASLAAAPADPIISCSPDDVINILFSSGTTGDPKAIPWDHTTPIKCASDAFFHMDLKPGDVAAWPTSLGWMMGPWLIFSALLNRATIALTDASPLTRQYGHFIQDAHVTMLGVIPSLVRSWRTSRCMERLDWRAIRCFASTGECSNPRDMLYLMHLAGPGYKPVIEYCGGTELAGAYITSTVIHPCVPAAFTTPTLGVDFVILDENAHPAPRGEVFVVPPSIGLSTRLLNTDRDHFAVYYERTPSGPGGQLLRRHGDELEEFWVAGQKYYRVLGRCDDTMNLGGIKVGCAQIERVLSALPGIRETAAIAVSPPGGGPSRLVIYAVPEHSLAEPARGRSSPDALALQSKLKLEMQQAIREQLSPLYKIHEVIAVDNLPRTASNKVMRRELRAAYIAPA